MVSSGNQKKTSGIELITLYQNSPDTKFIDPRFANLIARNVQGGFSSQAVQDEEGGNNEPNDVPQLEDISEFDNYLYIDEAGKTRAAIVIKVYNSSGKNLKGVDAAKSIVAQEGGS